GGEIAAERLLDDDAGEAGIVPRPDQAVLVELLEERRKGAGRRREVEEAVPAGGAGAIDLLELGSEAAERVVLVEGAGDVAQPGPEIAPHLRVHRLGAREPPHRLAPPVRVLPARTGRLG